MTPPMSEDANDNEPINISTRPATAHGWVRRTEFDTETYDAWEQPDGRMFACQKGKVPEVSTFNGARWFLHRGKSGDSP